MKRKEGWNLASVNTFDIRSSKAEVRQQLELKKWLHNLRYW